MAEMRTRKEKGFAKKVDNRGDDSLRRGSHCQSSAGPSPRSILLRRLYEYCTSSHSETQPEQDLLVNIHGHFLTREDTSSLCPSGWINNAVVSFTAMVINEDEGTCNSTARWCLKSYFVDEIAKEAENRINPVKSPIKSISSWFDVLVGVEYEMAVKLLQNLRLHDPTFPPGPEALQRKHVKLPKQANYDDCGVFTIKYMELWDPMRTYDGDLPMPKWTEADVADIRQELLLKWVLDQRNEVRDKVLKDSECEALCSGEPSMRGCGADAFHTASSQNGTNVGCEFFDAEGSAGVFAGGEPGHNSNNNTISTPSDDVNEAVEVLVSMPGK